MTARSRRAPRRLQDALGQLSAVAERLTGMVPAYRADAYARALGRDVVMREQTGEAWIGARRVGFDAAADVRKGVAVVVVLAGKLVCAVADGPRRADGTVKMHKVRGFVPLLGKVIDPCAHSFVENRLTAGEASP